MHIHLFIKGKEERGEKVMKEGRIVKYSSNTQCRCRYRWKEQRVREIERMKGR